jgi:hypothetical protein
VQGRATCVRSRAEREWTKRVWVGGAFSGRRAIPYSKVVNGPGRQDEQAWRILRQPARRVAQWRAKYDSDKIRPDLNRVTILDGPLLAPSGRTAEHRFQLSADFVAKVFLRHGTQILGAIGATIELSRRSNNNVGDRTVVSRTHGRFR